MLKEFCSKCFIIIFSSNFAGKTLRNKLHQKEITKKKLASAKNQIQNSLAISTDQQTP